MSGIRVVVRSLCPHNERGAHIEVVCVCHAAPAELHSDECRLSWPVCEEGDERELKVGSYVLVEKVDGRWPTWAMQAMGEAEAEAIRTARWSVYFDALSDHTEGTP